MSYICFNCKSTDEEHASKVKLEELEQQHKSELKRLNREKQEIAESYENKLKEIPTNEPKSPEVKGKGVIKIGVVLEQIQTLITEIGIELVEIDTEKQEKTRQAVITVIQNSLGNL